MEIDFKEDISNLNKTELALIRNALYRDKRFITYKVTYWNKIYKEIILFEKKITIRSLELKNRCEVCEVKINKKETRDCLKTLPDGRQVCQNCWNIITEQEFIKNFNK